jgi:hypothetical protein
MLFSVIYSADVPSNVSIRDYAPPSVRRLWTLTEGDSQFEYSFLPRRAMGERQAPQVDGNPYP